jgi:hypothetical protein
MPKPDAAHPAPAAKLKVTGASDHQRTVNVKSKLFAMLLPLLLPFVRNTILKQLNKVAAVVGNAVGSALLYAGVSDDQLAAYGTNHAEIIGGAITLAIGVIAVLVEWGATIISLKVNPPPKAVAVKEKE